MLNGMNDEIAEEAGEALGIFLFHTYKFLKRMFSCNSNLYNKDQHYNI